jgi:hypothetical protein
MVLFKVFGYGYGFLMDYLGIGSYNLCIAEDCCFGFGGQFLSSTGAALANVVSEPLNWRWKNHL